MRDPIMQFFSWSHLPERLKAVSEPFCSMAFHIEQTVPRNPERTVALRKLLEAKDAAVRAVLFKDEQAEAHKLKLTAAETGVQSVAAGPMSDEVKAEFDKNHWARKFDSKDIAQADRVFLDNAQQPMGFVLNLGQIAAIAHEANRALTRIVQDVPVQAEWDQCGDDMQASSVKGVLHHLNNPASGPESSHESWMRERLSTGWTLGPVKDVEKKTHPALVPYADLPLGTRLKDKLFTAIVKAMLKG